MLQTGDFVKLNKSYKKININSGEVGEVKQVKNNGMTCQVEFESYDGQNKGPARIISHMVDINTGDLEKITIE